MHNQSNYIPRDDIDALALRTWAASGFGDAPIGIAEQHKLLTSTEFHRRIRTLRSKHLRDMVTAALNSAANWVQRTVEQWRLQQRTHATFVALHELDARMLRDLGIHRSEILSVAAELARSVDCSRVRVARQ
ncbi:MAG: DUF1127 domain-containing protein [Burkholderiaceae bacterium]